MTKRTNDKITCSDCNYSWYVYQKDVGMNVYECEKCKKINRNEKESNYQFGIRYRLPRKD